MFSLKYFLMGAFFGLVLLFAFIVSLPDGKLHIVFCDVGQGDAQYIRTPQGQDILIDGGPNDQVLNCLGRHMPFYDRSLDLVILTHPEKDHLTGLLSVIDRYKIKYFVSGVEGHDTDGYKGLIDRLRTRRVHIRNVYSGDSLTAGEVRLRILWPSRQWVWSHVDTSPEPGPDLIGAGSAFLAGSDGNVLGLATKQELNDFSLYVHLSYRNFDALFTGDGDERIQDDVLAGTSVPDVEVLKFPHHGSKTGISVDFLDRIKPEFSVIQVGKKNSYGHPAVSVIKLLRSRAIQYKRTDEDGEVEVVSDGLKWWAI